MVGLKPVRVGNVLFVTTKANAAEMRQDPDLAPIPQPGNPGEKVMIAPGGAIIGAPVAIPAAAPAAPAKAAEPEESTDKPAAKKAKTEEEDKAAKPAEKSEKPEKPAEKPDKS
jgi:hypothetical protein